MRTFDAVYDDFLRCANKECECSYQNAKNDILNYYNISRNSKDVAIISPKGIYSSIKNYFFINTVPLKTGKKCL